MSLHRFAFGRRFRAPRPADSNGQRPGDGAPSESR